MLKRRLRDVGVGGEGRCIVQFTEEVHCTVYCILYSVYSVRMYSTYTKT